MHAEPLPLPEIDPAALLRDRTALDPAALDALKTSIAVEGLRLPIEVWQLSTPRPNPAGGPDHRYGLISGLRRLTACAALGHATIPAFLRTPDSISDPFRNRCERTITRRVHEADFCIVASKSFKRYRAYLKQALGIEVA